jgi:hypothetical protein
MPRRQHSGRGSARGGHYFTEIWQLRSVRVLILMRVLAWRWMLDHSSSRLSLEHDPCPISFFKIVGNLHPCSLRRSGLGAEFHFGMGLIPIDRSAFDIHFHGAQVQRTDSLQMLHDSRTNRVVIALLCFASTREQERYGKTQSQAVTFHPQFLSPICRTDRTGALTTYSPWRARDKYE